MSNFKVVRKFLTVTGNSGLSPVTGFLGIYYFPEV